MRTTRAGESALLLLDVVDVLRSGGVDYAVIGALAASIHGVVRASMDADVVLSVDPREASELRRMLEEAGFNAELTRGDFADPIAALVKAADSHGNRVDLLIGLRGLDSQAFARALDVSFQGETLRFIGREDFIAMKAFAGGPVDLVDAARAIAAAGASLDVELTRRLAQRFGTEAVETVERLLASGKSPK